MRHQMLDIIAISNRVRHLDIFLTTNCYRKEKEINEAYLAAHTASGRPDICARRFKLKWKALQHIVKKEQLLVRIVAWNCVIKFPKR